MVNDWKTCVSVAKFACQCRLAFLVLQLLTTLLPDYDTSACTSTRRPSDGHCPTSTLSFLRFGVKWDAEYFATIADDGYQYEQSMAFFPLLPKATRFVSQTVLRPIRLIGSISNREIVLLTSVGLSFVFFPLAASFLYLLGVDALDSRSDAYRAALLFCFNPASVFMCVMYTEAPFVAFSFLAMWLMRRELYGFATVAVALTCALRSNGILNAGILAYCILKGSSRQEDLLKRGLKVFLLCGLSVLPFLAYQAYGYYVLCASDDARPWCSWRLPLSYSFIQQHYWNFGFLRYFEVKQIPNFLLALPVFLLAVGYVGQFFARWKSEDRKGLWSSSAFPYVAHLAFIAILGATSMHVQVLTRFCFSASPAIYWYASYLMQPNSLGERKSSKAVSIYFVTYCVLGILMHCTFYPWT